LSASSSSGGAFSRVIDQVNKPASQAEGPAASSSAPGQQDVFSAELAARLAAPARPDNSSRPDIAALSKLAAQLGQPALRASPSASSPNPLGPAADALAGDRFLYELEQWLSDASYAAAHRTSGFSLRPSTDPRRE